jgi:integrase
MLFISNLWRNRGGKTNNMKTATVKIFIDSSHPKKDGAALISIRITHNQKKRYYSTGISLEPDIFKRLMTRKRRNEAEQSIYNRIHLFYEKALSIVSKMEIFTFSGFEDRYLTNKDAANDINTGFNDYIYLLESENKISTSINYRCSIRSLNSYKSDLKYADITPDFLRGYEAKMRKNGLKDSTLGFYLRPLRAIMNRANIDPSLYPFGRGRGKYTIPSSGRNFKKSLSEEEIIKIFNYVPISVQESRARDYWIFLYMCNGMNVRDFCNLKWSNYSGDVISFIREKSKRSKRDNSPVIVSVKPEAKDIISKWGVPSVHPNLFIFPHLRTDMSAKEIHQIVQLLTKNINTYLKRICKKLGIYKEVTTYYARHSFATVLKNKGASTEFISESLSHSSVKTTKQYLGSFDLEQIHQETEKLRFFAKK